MLPAKIKSRQHSDYVGFYIDYVSLYELGSKVIELLARAHPEMPLRTLRAEGGPISAATNSALTAPVIEHFQSLTKTQQEELVVALDGVVRSELLIQKIPSPSLLSPMQAADEARKVSDVFSKRFDLEISKAVVFYEELMHNVVMEMTSVRKKWEFLSGATLPSVYQQVRRAANLVSEALDFLDVNQEIVRELLKLVNETPLIDENKFVKERLSPDNVESRLASLRLHEGLGQVVKEIEERLNHMRRLENEYIDKKEIDTRVVKELHKRRNTLPLLLEISDQTKSVVMKNRWIRYLAIQAQIDYEKKPVGESEFWGLFLNNYNTLLYMANYYVVIPTASKYSRAVGMSGTVSGLLLAMAPLSALVASVIYSIWSNRSFKQPLLFCTVLLITGNLLYATALERQNRWFLFCGRLLVGLGGNRAVNRRYIADFVPMESRTWHSIMFVAVGSIGMSLGPGLQPLLNKVPHCTWHGHIFNRLTLPGWTMVVLWIAFFFQTLLQFNEPKRQYAAEPQRDLLEPLLVEPLLLNDCYQSSVVPQRKRLSSLLATTNVDGTALCLWVYFVLKTVQEAFQTAAPLVTLYYFSWSDSNVGGLLACIGVFVLPANFLVGFASGHVSDRACMVVALLMLMTGAVVTLDTTSLAGFWPMNEWRYVAGALLLFVSAQVLEGINMGLLSKVMPKVMSKGLWNSGFLSTEAGTLGRVFGAGMITAMAPLRSSDGDLQNLSMIPCVALILLALLVCWWKWDQLLPATARMGALQQDPMQGLLELDDPNLTQLNVSLLNSTLLDRLNSARQPSKIASPHVSHPRSPRVD